MQRVLHHLRDAVVSGNTFDVPLNNLERILMAYWPEAFGTHCYHDCYVYELPSYPVLGRALLVILTTII